MSLCPAHVELRPTRVSVDWTCLIPLTTIAGCRQVKLACDAQVRTPCTRCRDRNLECRFDQNFKRLSTRLLAREVTAEISNLQKSNKILSDGGFSISSNSHSSLVDARSPRKEEEQQPRMPLLQINDRQSSSAWLQVQTPPLEQARFVSAGLALSEEAVYNLFKQ